MCFLRIPCPQRLALRHQCLRSEPLEAASQVPSNHAPAGSLTAVFKAQGGSGWRYFE